MDVNMPVWDGLEATRRIKAEMPYIRILLLTASSAEAVRERALSDGAEDCVDKDASRILLAVKRLTG
jgi:CheY-like chemotaxis protein